MKPIRIIVALGLMIFVVVSAPVTNDDQQDTILSYENESDGTGNYKYSFKTAKGITREEEGNLVKDIEKPYILVTGSYSYFDPKGNKVDVSYFADTSGFHILDIPPISIPISGYGLPPSVVASLLG